jgi:exosortase family protein XrtF
MIREFKPTILFLVKFLAIYLVGNLLYGVWITDWYPQVDPLTHHVTDQSAWVIRAMGHDVQIVDYEGKPTTYIKLRDNAIVSVYEGCNGFNVVIVFLAFLLAFGPFNRSMIWFLPLGILVIHVANLARIVLLFWVSLYQPHYLYFTHKYLFTAFIYLFVFLLWIAWVKKWAKPTPHGPSA